MKQEIEQMRRRTFLGRATAALGSIIACGLAAPALRYLFSSPARAAETEWTPIGKTVSVAGVTPAQVTFERPVLDGWKRSTERASAWVVRSNEGEPVAFAPACTHLGCAYHWDNSADLFVCPCHGSTFTVDGRVKEGPAARPLERYRVRVDNGIVLLGPIASRS